MRMLSAERQAKVQTAINMQSDTLRTSNIVMSSELRGDIQRRSLTSFVGDVTEVYVVSVRNPFQVISRPG